MRYVSGWGFAEMPKGGKPLGYSPAKQHQNSLERYRRKKKAANEIVLKVNSDKESEGIFQTTLKPDCLKHANRG